MPSKKTIENAVSTEKTPSLLRAKIVANNNYKNFVLIGTGVVLVSLCIFFVFLYHQKSNELLKYKQQESTNQRTGYHDSSASTTNETQLLVEEVGKLIILPQNEQPTIATVSDLGKLKDQPFFVKAQIGDKVLIYTTAKRAILFRPSSNQIIEIAPLTIGESPDQLSKPAPTETLTLEIRNGSGTSGAANNFKLKFANDKNISVIKVGNTKKEYARTVLYIAHASTPHDLITTVQKISTADVVSSLPQGEPNTNADLLLIMGKN